MAGGLERGNSAQGQWKYDQDVAGGNERRWGEVAKRDDEKNQTLLNKKYVHLGRILIERNQRASFMIS